MSSILNRRSAGNFAKYLVITGNTFLQGEDVNIENKTESLGQASSTFVNIGPQSALDSLSTN